MLMYQLVTDLNRTSNPMLWLACVGLTDQLVHERVEYERYVKSAQLLQEEVAALNQEGDLETTEVYDANRCEVPDGTHQLIPRCSLAIHHRGLYSYMCHFVRL